MDDDRMRLLHDQHAHVLWRYALGFTAGDAAAAQDVVQETLLRAWRTPGVLDQSHGSARAWLFTVARRILIDEWRRGRSTREIVTETLPEVSVADDTDVIDTRTTVVSALRTLSADHRNVLVETYLRGASVAEAALRLGIPAGTVKSRTHYALHAFKLAVEKNGGLR